MTYPSKVAPFQRKWILRELHRFLILATLMTNYRPISVLPWFSNMLERIIYNRLYKYLTENNLFYCKQYRFQNWHSPEHSVLQFESIKSIFWKEPICHCCVSWFIQSFDTVHHQILLKKLKYYGVARNNLRWFEYYLKKQQQFVSLQQNSTKKLQ